MPTCKYSRNSVHAHKATSRPLRTSCTTYLCITIIKLTNKLSSAQSHWTTSSHHHLQRHLSTDTSVLPAGVLFSRQTSTGICPKAQSSVLWRGRTNNFHNLDQKHPQLWGAETWESRAWGGSLLHSAETTEQFNQKKKKKHEVNGNCRTKYAEGD